MSFNPVDKRLLQCVRSKRSYSKDLTSLACWGLLLALIISSHGSSANEAPKNTAGKRTETEQAGHKNKQSTAVANTTSLAAYSRTIPGTEVSFDMLPIAGGKFLMGSPADEADRDEGEGPQFTVEVEPFWMGKYEVTWSEYQEFMALCRIFEKFNDQNIRTVTRNNRVDSVTAPSKLYEPSFTYASGDSPRQPAVSMSQYGAKQFTKWLSLLTGEFYRLPTEAEWEYACRAGTTTAYSYGNDPDAFTDYGWYYKNSEDSYETSEVGQLKPNPWGLYDMHGNVMEWVLDQYDAEHYAQFAGKTVKAQDALLWPTKRFGRVVRGGAWNNDEATVCRSASRHFSNQDWVKDNDPHFAPGSPWWLASDAGQMVGFRLVRPKNPPPREEWNKYWDADLKKVQQNVEKRISEEGKGERGLVDPQLPEAIKQLKSTKQH